MSDEMTSIRVFGEPFERVARIRLWHTRIGRFYASVKYSAKWKHFRWDFLGKQGTESSPLAAARAIEDHARDVIYELVSFTGALPAGDPP